MMDITEIIDKQEEIIETQSKIIKELASVLLQYITQEEIDGITGGRWH